jgi:hypothetical protein
MKKLLIIDKTIRKSIGNICKNTVYPLACCCNEEKSTKYNQIIKEKVESTDISVKYIQIIIIMVLQPGSALTAPTKLLKEKVQLNPYFHL